MIILGIETSCDETGAAILEKKGNRVTILSNIIASSASLQAKYGGIIPEQAAREQIKSIVPVIEESLKASGKKPKDIDAIAVTFGPGLVGSLLVGLETAKTLALVWKKPLVPINHLIGHFYANWLGENTPSFPYIGLLVSGGHTNLVLFTGHNKYKYLGGTRDDASGECFDKCARLLGLAYPGGPEVSKLARKGNPKTFDLPRPMIDSKDSDFSFSGLKTAVANLIKTNPDLNKEDLAASLEAAIVDVLVEKTIRAVKKYGVDQIMVAGGVAANQKLTTDLKLKIENLKLKIKVAVPPPSLCTDNGAMIAAAGFFSKSTNNLFDLQADPSLAL